MSKSHRRAFSVFNCGLKSLNIEQSTAVQRRGVSFISCSNHLCWNDAASNSFGLWKRCQEVLLWFLTFLLARLCFIIVAGKYHQSA